jgi:hypothetical protein
MKEEQESKWRWKNCLFCKQSFPMMKSYQTFCSPKCRSDHHNGKRYDCQYCGNAVYKRMKGGDPTCRECERELLDRMNYSFSGKAEYLLGLYRSRYEEELRIIDWSKEELAAGDDDFRKKIRIALKSRYKVEERIAWLQYHSKKHTCLEELKKND